jgi:hypothetical protein
MGSIIKCRKCVADCISRCSENTPNMYISCRSALGLVHMQRIGCMPLGASIECLGSKYMLF